jgi:ATP-binding cassette, subfamily B, bacterial
MTSRASKPRGKSGHIVRRNEREAKAARLALHNSMKVMTADIAAQLSSNGHAKPEAALQNGARTAALDEDTPDPRKTRSLKPLLGLRSFIFRYKAKLVLAGVSLVLAATSTLALPIAVRFVIDHGFSGNDPSYINAAFLSLLAVVLVMAVASSTRFYAVTWLGERAVADLRDSVFRHLTTLSPAFYERNHSAELMSRLTADTTQIKTAVSTSVSQALRNSVMLIGALIMMIATSAKLSALVILAIPVIILPLIGYGRVVRRLSRKAQDELASASAYAAENLATPRTMQAFTFEDVVAARHAAAVDKSFEAARRRIGARAVLTATAIFLIFASIIGILWYGAHGVLAGTMSGGTLAQFVLYAAFAAGAVAELSEVWGEVQQAAGAAERLTEIRAIPPDIVSPDHPRPFLAARRGEVAFETVSFHYPGRKDAPVFTDLSFRIRPGERVAIVGPSGAGKSTIFALLLRFYDAQSGEVVVDGVPVKQADLKALRQHMAYVPQDPAVFAGTIADNIRYGTPGASDEAVRRAAETALAAGFIEALPAGYDTLLGERGVTLSGGQRQRLAIARAILRDAPILLLDEATSALDAESEALVQTALNRVMEGRTTLVIAHRLATVLGADRILVLDHGEIAEEGTHAELIGAGGIYARLAELQFGSEIGAA